MNLRENTSRSLLFGPFIDEADGKTRLTGLSLVSTDFRVSKNGSALAVPTFSSITHVWNGWYSGTAAVGDFDTPGTLEIICHKATALPVFSTHNVMKASIFDAMHSTGNLDVNVTKLDGFTLQSGLWTLSGKQLTLTNNTDSPLKLITAGTGINAISIESNNNGINISAQLHGINIAAMDTGINVVSAVGHGMNLTALGDGAHGLAAQAFGVAGTGIYCSGETSDLNCRELWGIADNIGDLRQDVLAIQNNTTFVASIASPIIKPEVPPAEPVWVEIRAYLRDTGGRMEDPDLNKVHIRLTKDQSGATKPGVFYELDRETEAGPSGPSYPEYDEMVRVAVGEFAIVLKVTDLFDQGAYTAHFRYTEDTNLQVFTRAIEIMDPGTGEAEPVLLADTYENWKILAKSLKTFPTHDYPVVYNSVVSNILVEIAKIVGKLPGGNISDLSLGNLVDGVTLEQIFALTKAWINGRFTVDPEAGTVTFYQQNNLTPLTVVQVTEHTRTRIM